MSHCIAINRVVGFCCTEEAFQTNLMSFGTKQSFVELTDEVDLSFVYREVCAGIRLGVGRNL